MMTATPIFLSYICKPYMPIIFLLKAFFKIFTFEKKILTFALRICSICLVLSGLSNHLLDTTTWKLGATTINSKEIKIGISHFEIRRRSNNIFYLI